MDKKEYKCKFCDKVFSLGKNRNRHEKVGIFFIYQGKCVKGRDSIVLGGTKRGGCPSSLNLCRGSGPLTPWGTGVHLGPGTWGPQPLVK